MITSLWLKMSDDDGSVPLGPSADSSSVCSDAASEFRMLEKLVDNLKKDIAEQKDQHIEECRTIRIECEDIKEQQNELIEQQRHLMRQLVDVSTTLQHEIINLQMRVATLEAWNMGATPREARVAGLAGATSVAQFGSAASRSPPGL